MVVLFSNSLSLQSITTECVADMAILGCINLEVSTSYGKTSDIIFINEQITQKYYPKWAKHSERLISKKGYLSIKNVDITSKVCSDICIAKLYPDRQKQDLASEIVNYVNCAPGDLHDDLFNKIMDLIIAMITSTNVTDISIFMPAIPRKIRRLDLDTTTIGEQLLETAIFRDYARSAEASLEIQLTEKLYFALQDFKRRLIEFMSCFKNLQQLKLRYPETYLSDNELLMKFHYEVQKISTIKELKIISPCTEALLTSLVKNSKSLESIYIESLPVIFARNCQRFISQLTKLPNLKKLKFGDISRFTFRTQDVITIITSVKGLRELQLEANFADTIEKLSNKVKDTDKYGLTSISIICPNTFHIQQIAKRFPFLTKLEITLAKVDDELSTSLGSLTTVKCLLISSESEEIFAEVVKALGKHLEQLEISNYEMRPIPEFLQAKEKYINLPNLKRLTIRHFSNIQLQTLIALHSGLRTLKLVDCMDSGIEENPRNNNNQCLKDFRVIRGIFHPPNLLNVITDAKLELDCFLLNRPGCRDGSLITLEKLLIGSSCPSLNELHICNYELIDILAFDAVSGLPLTSSFKRILDKFPALSILYIYEDFLSFFELLQVRQLAKEYNILLNFYSSYNAALVTPYFMSATRLMYVSTYLLV